MDRKGVNLPEGAWEFRLIFLAHIVQVGDEEDEGEEEHETVFLPDKVDVIRSREFAFNSFICDADDAQGEHDIEEVGTRDFHVFQVVFILIFFVLLFDNDETFESHFEEIQREDDEQVKEEFRQEYAQVRNQPFNGNVSLADFGNVKAAGSLWRLKTQRFRYIYNSSMLLIKVLIATLSHSRHFL